MFLTSGGLYLLPEDDAFFCSDEKVVLTFEYHLTSFGPKYTKVVGVFPLNKIREISKEFLYSFSHKMMSFVEFRAGDFSIVKIKEGGYCDE